MGAIQHVIVVDETDEGNKQMVKLLASMILLAVLCACPLARVAVAQTEYQCAELMNRQTSALRNHQWQALVDAARQFLTVCRDVVPIRAQSTALGELGTALNQIKQYEDAIPVLRRCVSIAPDDAGCWYDLGEASFYLGRIQDAKKFFRQAIESGAFDTVNAGAIASAKRSLALLEKEFPERNPPDGESAKNPEPPHAFGTGFFVSTEGHIITNDHVVSGCKTLTTRGGIGLEVVGRSPNSDLALLKAPTRPAAVAVFRTGPAPKLGDAVVAFGFPLPGLLSSEGNVAVGVLSATSGLQNDIRYIQISAPVQPGNSGGPLLDSSGHVIGVVVAKLDAIQVARLTGDIPQNINFAVQWSAVRAFLDEHGVRYSRGPSQRGMSTSSIAADASRFSVAIDCVQ